MQLIDEVALGRTAVEARLGRDGVVITEDALAERRDVAPRAEVGANADDGDRWMSVRAGSVSDGNSPSVAYASGSDGRILLHKHVRVDPTEAEGVDGRPPRRLVRAARPRARLAQ